MKSSTHFLVLIVVCMATLLTGCGGGGGGGGGDVGPAANNSQTITTKVFQPAAPTGSVRGAVRPATLAQTTSGTLVKGAIVTLTMADGTTYTMSDDGNGNYSANVTNITGAAGFFIEAHKGDLEVQNLVTDLGNTDLTNLTTDYLTTTFTQVALAFAKHENAIQVASATELLKNVANISIEFTQLRREVTDPTNVTYEQTRTFFQAGLSGANTDLATTPEGTSLLDQLAAGTLKPTVGSETFDWTEVISTPIESGTLTPPAAAPAADEDQIKAVANAFLDGLKKFFGQTSLSDTDIAAISGVLSEGLIHDGQTKATLLNQLKQGNTKVEDSVFERFEGDIVLRRVDQDTYLVGLAGTVFQKDRDGVSYSTVEDSFKYGYNLASKTSTFPTVYTANGLDPDTMFPFLVRRETAGWKILGNGIKVNGLWIKLIYRNYPWMQAPNKRTAFWLGLEDTTTFPVESVTFSGTNAPTPVGLAKDPQLSDSNTWHYWYTDTNQNRYMADYPNNGFTGNVTHKNGDEYRFVVTFKDGTTQTFIHRVVNLPADWAPLEATLTPGTTGVSVTWAKFPYPDFDGYHFNLNNTQGQGDPRILEKRMRDINTTSTSFPYQTSAYNLVTGAEVEVMIESNSRWGFASVFNGRLIVPQH